LSFCFQIAFRVFEREIRILFFGSFDVEKITQIDVAQTQITVALRCERQL
jgi:hypothetical protein